MQQNSLWFTTLLLLALTATPPSTADCAERLGNSIGLRGGVSDGRNDENFEQYDVYMTLGLPWKKSLSENWLLGTRLDVSAGALRAAGDTGFTGSVGPTLAFDWARGRFLFDVGISATFLSEDHYGDEDLGGNIHFMSHAGIAARIAGPVSLGYRFHHLSNAHLDSTNPGLNMHMAELSYRF